MNVVSNISNVIENQPYWLLDQHKINTYTKYKL